MAGMIARDSKFQIRKKRHSTTFTWAKRHVYVCSNSGEPWGRAIYFGRCDIRRLYPVGLAFAGRDWLNIIPWLFFSYFPRAVAMRMLDAGGCWAGWITPGTKTEGIDTVHSWTVWFRMWHGGVDDINYMQHKSQRWALNEWGFGDWLKFSRFFSKYAHAMLERSASGWWVHDILISWIRCWEFHQNWPSFTSFFGKLTCS